MAVLVYIKMRLNLKKYELLIQIYDKINNDYKYYLIFSFSNELKNNENFNIIQLLKFPLETI